LYCSASSLGSDTEKLQSAFNTIQGNLHKLRLVLNSDKTKIMCFSKSRKTDDACQIVALGKRVIEEVPVYQYLGFFLEGNLSFKHHIECLTKKLRVKLGFYYGNKCGFPFSVRKRHWYIFLFKATLFELPPYICSLLTPKVSTRNFNLRSYGQIM
jgi:hypothetical protein